MEESSYALNHPLGPTSTRPCAVLTESSADPSVPQGASAIAYASIVSLIFAARYLDVIRWAFKLSWMALAVTVSAEAAGKLVLSHGLATQMRPRRYYTVSRATLDSMIGDVHELVNFFVIEGQRILFAENLGASAAVSCNPSRDPFTQT